MKKIVVILDALKANKIELVKSILGNEVNPVEVVPPFSFEPDAAYLCGKYPEESDAGLKFWKADKINESKLFSCLKWLPNKPRLFRKIINKFISKFKFNDLSKYKNNFASIPFKFLKYFELSQELELFGKKSGFKYKTIFDLINEDYCYVGVPHTSGRLDNVKKELRKVDLENCNTLFLYISDLDHTGHKFGGNSTEYDEKLREIIIFLKELFDMDKNKIEYLIFGDHGMVNSKRFINIEKILKKMPLKIEKDYLYFLDSTMVRFWFKNEEAKKCIIEELSNLKSGSWISEQDKIEYKIRYKHDKYGESIWWANDGVMISPNFWQGEKKLKGMHGYRNNSVDNHTTIISNVNNNSAKKVIEMVEVNKMIKEFLGI